MTPNEKAKAAVDYYQERLDSDDPVPLLKVAREFRVGTEPFIRELKSRDETRRVRKSHRKKGFQTYCIFRYAVRMATALDLMELYGIPIGRAAKRMGLDWRCVRNAWERRIEEP